MGGGGEVAGKNREILLYQKNLIFTSKKLPTKCRNSYKIPLKIRVDSESLSDLWATQGSRRFEKIVPSLIKKGSVPRSFQKDVF
ncbi:hypothetical protein CH380_17390 [Leptospira adleri]|uniref:Uncharacterized protein n=1 Tax=Leptospira adleri TaxID=2023186 RepID=A0A2M9YKD1_9LEPT|nr:hypothetical protein CH380_17390 [Leptospira adleri]PJZ59618.1 hypothetical protein CH376_22830 [Leptospira adleri]